MSSLKNAVKTQKTHRERHQPDSRKTLGLLEKRKDYKLRAKDYNKKKTTLKRLRQKALDKNPDEFYFHMINSQTVSGVHQEKSKDEVLTEEQIKLMQTRDLTYIVHKRSVEKKKIEKLQSTLHLLDTEEKPTNSHTFFVDTDAEKKDFNVARRLGTHEALLDRTFNRPKLDDLRSSNFLSDLSTETQAEVHKKRLKAYKELQQRIARERQLAVIQGKMEIKKHLQAKNEKPLAVVKEETKTSAPIYKWPKERKR